MICKTLNDGWTLAGYYTCAPFAGHALENGALPKSITGEISAAVPGSITADLVTAGILKDPYFEMQSLSQEWIGNRWWVYTNKDIRIGQEYKGRTIRLVFKGIDYRAHIYFNRKKLGEHTGMFHPAVFDITEFIDFDAPNTLRVCLEHTPFEHSYTGYISEKSTVKTHCSYKWDFCCRMVDMGLYDEVLLDISGNACFGYTDIRWNGEILSAGAEIHAIKNSRGTVKAELFFEGESVSAATRVLPLCGGANKVVLKLAVKDPKLWYPNGYGEQPLYKCEYTVTEENTVSDTMIKAVGLRTLEHIRTDHAPDGAYPYLVKINGKRIWMKGVNLCPTDLMTGLSTDLRYERLIKQAYDANINAFRMWGGGNFERESFYSLCDKYGIMIFHDFLQSNATTPAFPNSGPGFLKLFGNIMTHMVKTLQSHPCPVLFSGGNEIRNPDTGGTIEMSDPNISMLKAIADEYAPEILMLPACGSGPSPLIDLNKPDDKENYHDVHGPWQYTGVKDHYRLWNIRTSMLDSEFGCSGMTNYGTLEKIIGKEHLHTNAGNTFGNPVWYHHHDGWDTYLRDSALFGQMETGDYIRASQFIMAEGLRYAYESCRRRAFVNCGAFAWQLNEPWPNSACTNIIDYYGNPKLAYYFIRDALKPVHVSMEYGSLVYKPGEEFKGRVFIHSDNQNIPYKLTIRIIKKEETVREINFEGTAISGKAIQAGELHFNTGCGTHFTVECILDAGGIADTNSYLFFNQRESEPLDLEAVKSFISRYPEAEINKI